jgi:hypothetical protein|uniref:Uncharacterized protein n=1 Tax=viral metagenome TaxID=1070528 RepID=A0A6C0CR39_9ZZZZ
MNRSFDYNGVQVSPSKPVQKLVKRTRVLHLDSADRDTTVYPNNGRFTLYLPRTYERVTSINIKDAEFPQTLVDTLGTTVNIWTGADSTGSISTGQPIGEQPKYFFLEVQGLNMSDETAPYPGRSASTNSVFGKFVVSNPSDPLVTYNESSNAHQTIEFYPALTKLDRLQFKLRTHTMDQSSYMYWPVGDWSMSLDIETLENSFDEFSTIETRLGDRA